MRELDLLLNAALKAGATDLHVSERIAPRMRVDNALRLMTYNMPCGADVIFAQVMDSLKPAEREIAMKKFERRADIDCAFTAFYGGRVRANIYWSENGLSIAFRMIPQKRLAADEIGLPFQIAEVCKAKNGLFIISGANGSGKTTTIAAMIDMINNTRDAHVLTIEDPVEYIIESKRAMISQREIGLHTPTFYEALRSSVRENPDIIVLGEMRDLETTRTAIELAETGHLVLATLHTRTAISTIDRLIGQFPAGEQPQIRLMIADNLIGVLTQSLLTRKRGGLIAAFELFLANYAARNLIRESRIPQIYSILQTSHKAGMCTMDDSLLKFVENKTVTAAEAMSKSPSRQQFAEMLTNSPLVDKSELSQII